MAQPTPSNENGRDTDRDDKREHSLPNQERGATTARTDLAARIDITATTVRTVRLLYSLYLVHPYLHQHSFYKDFCHKNSLSQATLVEDTYNLCGETNSTASMVIPVIDQVYTRAHHSQLHKPSMLVLKRYPCDKSQTTLRQTEKIIYRCALTNLLLN
jgi:hypothetical protein